MRITAASYDDVLTPAAVAALEALAFLDDKRRDLMQTRLDRRASRARERQRIAFPSPTSTIEGTTIVVQDARDGRFAGSDIPHDLRRQWIQGTWERAGEDN